MKVSGQLLMMDYEFREPIDYFLRLGEASVPITPKVGHDLTMKFLGKITCIECGRKIKKTYNQGYCYPCFQDLPENSICGVRPERCEHEHGNERDKEFFRTRCNVDHFVYLSLTSGVKVGVTRHVNIPSRWIDQGAVQGLIIARTPQRKFAGEIEVALAAHMADKTNWRKMLSGQVAEADLPALRDKALQWFPKDLMRYAVEEETVQDLVYPIESLPQKITSHNLDKIGAFTDTLTAIKGQYLIFEHRVINLRKYAGYHVEFSLA